MGVKRVVFDCETVGPNDPEILAGIAEGLKDEEPPTQVRRGGEAWDVLEELGASEYYAELKKGKTEYLEEIWPQEATLAARLKIAVRKMALDPLFARVVTIGVAEDDGAPYGLTVAGDDAESERYVLERFAARVNEVAGSETVWIGHNVIGYDIPLLISRMRFHEIDPPAHFPWWARGRMRGGRVFDTMREVATSQPFTSADKASLSLGCGLVKVIEWQGEPMNGKRVADAYEAGELDLIERYCLADVAATRRMAERMTYGWRLMDFDGVLVSHRF